MKPPEELKSLGDWPNFQDQMVSYLAHHRSSKTGVILSYVGRGHEAVTDEMLPAEYDSIDLDLYHTTLLTGGPVQPGSAACIRPCETSLC